jgi:hypothetical protein
VAALRPVLSQLKVYSSRGAKSAPAGSQHFVARIHAESVRPEVALMGERLEIVLEWGKPVGVGCGPQLEGGDVLQNRRKGD